eukprot:gnl/MRDRNA2_/MRDRNA2_84741_c0_seq1.p2 gnl/MRDRNA2_/MRDRNA2_84741_c0~~gnl/MRDRNA2_/MRDRNA2_84741_c0_seq1.p2  ORF type:complete len:106 (+),score=22.30 gnl/MRDRNA2_/MRDRNA2_84741_c0_seq1:443-760(+)
MPDDSVQMLSTDSCGQFGSVQSQGQMHHSIWEMDQQDGAPLGKATQDALQVASSWCPNGAGILTAGPTGIVIWAETGLGFDVHVVLESSMQGFLWTRFAENDFEA